MIVILAEKFDNKSEYVRQKLLAVLMMNLPLLRENLRFDDICKFSEKKKQMFILPDQDILTALYGEHVKMIDNLKYNLSDRTLLAYNADPRNIAIDDCWVRENTSIIHYFGRNKPWKKNYAGILDTFYNEIEKEYTDYWFAKGRKLTKYHWRGCKKYLRKIWIQEKNSLLPLQQMTECPMWK